LLGCRVTGTGGVPDVRDGVVLASASDQAHFAEPVAAYEIHKVLNHSSGAIANALDALVKLGNAELATEKPRRFRRAAKPAAAAPETDGADSGQGGTELAGAAW
jgi:hypothetical protein